MHDRLAGLQSLADPIKSNFRPEASLDVFRQPWNRPARRLAPMT